MTEYTKQFKPELSKDWHTDEQMIKVNGKWLYNWNVMDEHTRFLIATTSLCKSIFIGYEFGSLKDNITLHIFQRNTSSSEIAGFHSQLVLYLSLLARMFH